MEGKVIVELLIIQFLLVLTLVFTIIFLILFFKNLKLQKKFSQYTIKSIKNDKPSFFDSFVLFFENAMIKHGKFLSRFKGLKSYAKNYDKHLTYEDLKTKDGMYYISIKFILGYTLLILYLVMDAIQYIPITFSGIVLSFLIGFFVLDLFIYISYKRKRKEVSDELLKAIIIMNNSFKTGRSTMQAVEIVKNELSGSISDEFKKIYLDMSYGLSLEIVFERFYERVKLEDARYIATSLTLLNKTGGNIIKVFGSIEREFYNKKRINNELKAMTSSSNFVFKMLLLVPVLEYLLIFILNKDFFNPLFETGIGKIILLFVIVLYIMYIVVVKKIMKV